MDPANTDSPSGRARVPSPLLRLALEIGPLVVFFVVNSRTNIFRGTAAFMIAIVIALAVSWFLERRVPIMPLVTAVFVLVFGGLTLYLEDSLFIKLKPTIVNCLFATILLGGLATGRSFLKPVMGEAFQMNEQGWRRLTLRWAGFFLLLAALNEFVWRNYDESVWVKFKVFGIMPLTMLFAISQMGLIRRHHTGPAE
jgi:intracellular septation protein